MSLVSTDPVAVVQRQLDAFNARDLEAWAATYAPDAVQYQVPAVELARGRGAIASRMADRFAHDAATKAQLVRRTVWGGTVVDHEVVSRNYPQGVGQYELIATYQVAEGRIRTATFAFSDPVFHPAPPRPQRWAVVFTDTPGMLAVRKEREARHLAYLRDHQDEIVLAGGCRPAPGEPFVGGLWVIETTSRDRAVELVENDPYFVPEFRSYRLTTWGKALDGDVVL